MLVTITNISSEQVYVGDIYTAIEAGKSVTVERSTSDLSDMKALMALMSQAKVTVATVATADEAASGFLDQAAGVPAATKVADDFVIRCPFPVGAGGADDVQIYALNKVPFKFRVMGGRALVSVAGAGGSLVQARTAAAVGGTLLQEFSTATTGNQDPTATVTATQVVTPGASVGLFLRRSDSTAVGEVLLDCRREA